MGPRLIDETVPDHHGVRMMKWGVKAPPSEPVRVTVEKHPVIGYRICLVDNLIGSEPYWSLTLKGARRKASRVLYKWCTTRGLLKKRMVLEYFEEGLSQGEHS